jgi:hypothetical protein
MGNASRVEENNARTMYFRFEGVSYKSSKQHSYKNTETLARTKSPRRNYLLDFSRFWRHAGKPECWAFLCFFGTSLLRHTQLLPARENTGGDHMNLIQAFFDLRNKLILRDSKVRLWFLKAVIPEWSLCPFVSAPWCVLLHISSSAICVASPLPLASTATPSMACKRL